jgi:hypothetical protein
MLFTLAWALVDHFGGQVDVIGPYSGGDSV